VTYVAIDRAREACSARFVKGALLKTCPLLNTSRGGPSDVIQRERLFGVAAPIVAVSSDYCSNVRVLAGERLGEEERP
jgi:hypothetical protein